MSGLFITGTDTGVGKTLISCGIAAALRRQRVAVAVMKPVETGCEPDADGELRAADAEALRWFAGSNQPSDQICPIRLREPLAPMVAAERAGIQVDLQRIRSAYQSLAASADLVLVEGAGGLLVPITPTVAMADLARELGLAVLVVVGSKLGAINHALLTCEVARARKLEVRGYVVNFPSPGADLAAETNVDVLERALGPAVGIIPYQSEGLARTESNRDHLAEVFSSRLALDRL